jgi:hypothetical protein
MCDDNQSTYSGESNQSSSLKKAECPHCNKDLQTRYLFNHIYTSHFEEFIDSTTTRSIEKAANGDALRLVWFVKDDFDEEQDVTIYACMASKKTFLSELRINAHFKKNPDLLKTHKKEMKALLKDIEKEKIAADKKRNKNPTLTKWRIAKETNDPEVARIMWRSILWFSKSSKKIVETAKRNLDCSSYPMVSRYETFLQHFETMQEWIDDFEIKHAEMEQLLQSKCLEWKKLDGLTAYFHAFTNKSLSYLWPEEGFGALYDWNSSQCLRVQPNDFDIDMMFLANEGMPTVDF